MSEWALYIGPDKAGSTWLDRVARLHPKISMPESKELFYFDRYYERGWEWYLSRFPEADEEVIKFEISHDYLFSPLAANRIAKDIPEARLIVCARHPVDRALSSYMYMRRQGRIEDMPFSEALRRIPELIDHGAYGKHLNAYAERHDLRRIALLDFDVLRHSPRVFANSFFEALGIHPLEVPRAYVTAAKPASSPRNVLFARLAKAMAIQMRDAGLERLLGHVKRSNLIERLLFRPVAANERPQASQVDWEYMRERLHDDTGMLDRMFGSSYQDRWWRRPSSVNLPG